MKQVCIIVLLYVIGGLKLTEAGKPTHPQQNNGTKTPKLTYVALVDGKAFFVDTSIARIREEALNYCESLGMQLAVITSAKQFAALDQAVVDEWPNQYATWTGGKEATGIERYVWESSKPNVACSDIRYEHRFGEDFILFWKSANSYLSNGVSTDLCYTLCETFQSDKQYLQYMN